MKLHHNDSYRATSSKSRVYTRRFSIEACHVTNAAFAPVVFPHRHFFGVSPPAADQLSSIDQRAPVFTCLSPCAAAYSKQKRGPLARSIAELNMLLTLSPSQFLAKQKPHFEYFETCRVHLQVFLVRDHFRSFVIHNSRP